jgi:hypothetical protein
VIIFGFLAFLFKRRNQFWYGMIEACFGVTSAITLAFSVLPSDMHMPQWASLAGCVYVIARGMSNVSNALGDPGFSDIAPIFAEPIREGPPDLS